MIQIRLIRETDSIEEITRLLNRAYAELAAMGLRYVAAWQTADMTAKTVSSDICLLAVDEDKIVGTVMLYDPYDDQECPFYGQPEVRHFGKFAVDPDRRGEGIGAMLYQTAERLARESGAKTIACDTAEQAAHLISLYEKWGFQIIDRVDWSETNYISVVLAKSLE
jgi:ribosomal protein S18 acetylase RimI-like enzyme